MIQIINQTGFGVVVLGGGVFLLLLFLRKRERDGAREVSIEGMNQIVSLTLMKFVFNLLSFVIVINIHKTSKLVVVFK